MFSGCCGGPSCKSVVFSEASADSYVEMTPMRPMNLTAFTLCMRLATELSSDREIILFAYRTQQWDELNVWRKPNDRYLFLCIRTHEQS